MVAACGGGSWLAGEVVNLDGVMQIRTGKYFNWMQLFKEDYFLIALISTIESCGHIDDEEERLLFPKQILVSSAVYHGYGEEKQKGRKITNIFIFYVVVKLKE